VRKRKRNQRGLPRTTPATIKAAAPSKEFAILDADNSLGEGWLEAADGEGDAPKLRKFSIVAYTGGPMSLGFGHPVVVDLAGMEVSEKSRPILRDHEPSRILGHTTAVKITTKTITVAGILSAANDYAREVAQSADQGFPWQASIGARAKEMAFVEDGAKVTVNGRKFVGPLYVARQSVLGEVSFVALGADDSTSARMVAQSAATQTGATQMKFETWVAAKGMVLADLNDDTKAALRAMFDAEEAATLAANAGGQDTLQAAAGNDGASLSQSVETGVAAIRAEAARVGGIYAACVAHPEIAANAITNNWSVEKATTQVELATLRAARPTAPNLNLGAGGPDRMTVIHAAIQAAARIDNAVIIADTSAAALEAAHREFRAGIGMQELLLEAAITNGYQSRSIGSVRSDLDGVLRAAFSTMSLPGILGATANKGVAAGFDGVESSWRMLAAIRPVNDFKTVTSYTLTGDMQYDQIAPDGELKHGAVGETSYTNKADTFGKLFSITRQNIINDDLGVLSSVPRKIGRGAALKLNDVFWTEFMADASTFYTSGRGNYDDGTDTVLDIDGLTAAELLFLNQTDPDSKPLGVDPAILLVPNAHFVTATNLMRSMEVNDGASGATMVRNPHAGKFQVVKSSYLGNSAYTGYSVLAWYLIADPNDLPVIEMAFLNGVETPTVETADADFNTLGITMRGYHDFGCNKQEYRAAVKFKGEA